MTPALATIVQVSALVLAALLAAALMRRQSASARHWLLAVTVICAMALPALTPLVPAWGRPAARIEMGQAVAADAAVVLEAERAGEVAVPAGAETASQSRAWLPASAGAWLAAAWLAGSLLSVLALAAGFLYLTRVARRAEPVVSGRWPVMAGEVAAALGLRRRVALLQSDHPSLLVTWGLWRPRVLLPAPARTWDDERIRVVLAHELAHVARGDWAAQVGAELLRAAYWFNPLAWVAARRLRHEAERACDDAVLALGVPAPDYAGHLLDLTRLLGRRRICVPAAAMARRSGLERRVAAMLHPGHHRRPVSVPARAACAAALLLATIAVAGLGAQGAAGLSGTVFDETNRVVPGVEIRLVNPDTRAEYATETGPAGQYDLRNVPVGDYLLMIVMPGFRTVERPVALTGLLALDPVLDVGGLEETLRVTASGGDGPPRDRRFTGDPPTAPTCESSTTGGVIQPPAKLVDAAPVYPSSETGSQVTEVVLDATIGRDGFVREATVATPTDDAFVASAIDAVRRWQFSPTYLNCVPVEVSMTVYVTFSPE